jgi:cytosine/adenosine deaminase-related metal-dependent hydrolase
VKTLLSAAAIAPMNPANENELLRDAAVVFDEDRIIAVGDAKELRRSHPDTDLVEVGDAVVLPGLVNAHVHLELSLMCAGAPPADGFGGWLLRVVRERLAHGDRLSEIVGEAVEAGVSQCLRFGMTCVGDISRECVASRAALANLPIRAVSYGEVQSMAGRRHLLERRLAAALDTTHASDRLRMAITPHAPYTIEPDAYRRCLAVARELNWPIATHLAESAAEAEFLEHHTGPFRELWDTLGFWTDDVPKFSGGPIRYAKSLGLLDYEKTLLAHVNYLDDDEMDILAKSRASVVYCPRTHAYFRHPTHRIAEMLSRGINVALGTDSCGSSPDLNLLDDVRLVHAQQPAWPPGKLLGLVTWRAAKAIGLGDRAGQILPGFAPDFCIFKGASGLQEILQTSAAPAQVWVGGRAV